jgi:plastocyanin
MRQRHFRRAGLVCLSILPLAACHNAPPATDMARQAAASSVDWNAAPAVIVRITDFAFDPKSLSLRAGAPVRIMLVNDSASEHVFSAPAFLAASSFGPQSTPVADGGVSITAHQTREVDLVPAKPGSYPLECTELLHAMLGMTGSIEVTTR